MLRAVEAPAVAPAFDALIDHSVEGYAVALEDRYTLVARRLTGVKSHVEGTHELGVIPGQFLSTVGIAPTLQQGGEQWPVEVIGRDLSQTHFRRALAREAIDIMKGAQGGRRGNE